MLGVIGLIFSTDSASFDATRWQVAEAAIHHGYSANQILGLTTELIDLVTQDLREANAAAQVVEPLAEAHASA